MVGFFDIQSEYSFLNSMLRIDDLVFRAKEMQYEFLALNDTNMHAAYKYYKASKKNNLRVIYGYKCNVISNSLHETYLLIYAKNYNGYQALLKIASIDGSKSIDDIKKYSDDLIIIAGTDNEIYINHLKGFDEEVKNIIRIYQESFNNFYLGFDPIASNDISEFISKNRILPVSKSLYFSKDDKEAFNYLKAIKNGKYEDDRFDYGLPTIDNLKEKFKGYEYVFDNLDRVFNDFEFFDIPKVSKTLPDYINKKNIPSKKYLFELCELGLNRRYGADAYKYKDRLNMELEVISNMGYDNYFLIVYDFILYAKKERKILVGPGRGSAAGSLVAYVLGITNVDPMKYNLLFERFLNKERVSMPDIDTDFPDDRRDEVIKYVVDTYKMNHVCHISTFQTFQSKMALRDVSKIMKTNDLVVEEIIKRVSDKTLKELMQDEYFIKLRNSSNEANRLLQVASKIEGLPRQVGTHAAGIIISNDDIFKTTAVNIGNDGFYQAQFDAHDLEELGLLKMDFLGIKNLSTIQNIIDMIKQEDKNFDLSKIPLNDKKTFDLISNADTTGIFQLESMGMKRVLLKLKPNNIEDIIAVLALYRPGPMEQIDTYIARKNGEHFEYLTKELEPILKSTYGIIVYQEQIIQIASKFAGYSLGEADILRRAISKKNHDVLESERIKFVSRANSNKANEIYDYIVKFADYGFNRSHSVAYALFAYQMAYLKANYEKYFIMELINSVIGDEKKRTEYIISARNKGYNILSPDINKSQKNCIYDNGIILPITTLKGVGESISNKILLERKNGIYLDIHDFKKRLDNILGEGLYQSLVFSGALDSFGLTKKQLIEKRVVTNAFDKYNTELVNKTDEYDNSILLLKEKELLGLNIKYDRFEPYKMIIKQKRLKRLSEIRKDSYVNVIAYIKHIKRLTTKKGEGMAFILLSDDKVDYECVVFPNLYSLLKNNIKYDIILCVEAKVEERNGKLNLIASNIELL